ncbi:MAG TPA: FAD binding domain-containing protein, partial [Desulfomonilaceae bacterium]|nr:FAD binding domain-containing protein [Desulfomonilaceae bacterium]
MRLPRFQPLQPKSIEEAAEFLGKYGGVAEIMAGGTDLFPRIKYGVASPEVVITLRKLSRESQIAIQDGFLSIDSVTTLSQVIRSELVREHAPLLADAALAVGSHQIRNMGTLGGNLCLESRCTYYNQSHA